MPSPRAALPFTVALITLLAGCLGGPPPGDPVAEETMNRTTDALRDVTAYSYTVDGEARVSGDDRSRSIDFEGEGRVNVTTRRLQRSVRTDEDHEALYLDGRTVYRECPFSRYVNVPDAWYPTPVPENRSWHSLTTLGVVELLADAPVYDAGNETVDGVRTHVVAIRPSTSRARRLERRAVASGRNAPDRGRLQNLTVRLWVTAGTDLPARMEITERRSVDGVALSTRQILEFDYDPAPVSIPESTVESEAACPEPSGLDDA